MKQLTGSIIALSFVLFNIASAQAETPRVFLEERTDGEQFSYLYGSLETAMAINKLQGNDEKSSCIKNWFVDNSDEANQEFINAVHQVKDKDFPVAAVILILIDRHCDKPNIE